MKLYLLNIVFHLFIIYNVYMKTLFVNEKYNGKKLNSFLQDTFNLSTNLFYKTLRKKDIRINQKRVNENVILKLGDKVDVYIDDYHLNNSLKLDIIYEDNNILVVNKPSNIEIIGNNSITRNFIL